MKLKFYLSVSVLLCVLSTVYATENVFRVFDKFVQSSDVAILQSFYGEQLRESGAKTGVFFVCLNGKIISGRIFDFDNIKDEKKLLQKTYPLGETSIALVSLLGLSLQEQGLVNLSADVNKYFSTFRLSSGNLKGVNAKNLLSQSAGVPYLADKIPPECSAEEFFDTLAQMNFSIANTKYTPSVASPTIAAYALAYAYQPNSKDLKKSFVKLLRKHLFTPLRISSPKFRLFDKWFFPAYSIALNPTDIAKWLECESSPTPQISTAENIALRRVEKSLPYSQGWLKKDDFCCSAFVASSSGNFTLICRNGNDTLAISMFSDSTKLKKSKKMFNDIANQANNMLKKYLK